MSNSLGKTEEELFNSRNLPGNNDLNSTSKVLTTSVLYLQKRAVDDLEDGFLFFGQGHHARKLEPVLGVAEINFVHGCNEPRFFPSS